MGNPFEDSLGGKQVILIGGKYLTLAPKKVYRLGF